MANGPKRFRVAVVTPYFTESDAYLQRCAESVSRQTFPCDHIFIADGRPREYAERLADAHVALPMAHDDFGCTPRAIGSFLATGEHYDAITYLDADNWVSEDHIETLVALHRESGAAVTSTSRVKCAIDETPLYLDLTPEAQFRDTSSFMLFRRAFRFVALWGLMDPRLRPICDRVFWTEIVRSGVQRASSKRVTLFYREHHAHAYLIAGIKPPPDAKETNVRAGHAVKLAASMGIPDIDWVNCHLKPEVRSDLLLRSNGL